MNRIRTIWVGSLMSLTLTAWGGNWPAWRGGADGAGITSESGLPVTWSETKNIRWRIPLPERGNSTPIVWAQKIFLTQAIESEHRRTIMCFDRSNGALLWQAGTAYAEPETTHDTNPYCAASPVTDGERVIATFGSAGVFCYDFSGKQLWRRDLGKQIHGWGNASSPVLYRDLCILYHGPGKGAFLIAMNKRTGEPVWKMDLPEPVPAKRTDGFAGQEPGIIGSFSTPIIGKTKDREELVMSLPEQLRAFDPATGRALWFSAGLNPLVYTSPIWGEETVVAMGGYNGSALAVKPGGAGDVTGTKRLWHEVRAKKNRIGSGVISGGHIFVLNSDGIAECIELASGKSVWDARLKGPAANSESWSSVLLAGDKLYFLNKSGETHVVRASTTFEPIAVNSLGEETNSSPVPSDGNIFIRTYRSLWCVGADQKTAAK